MYNGATSVEIDNNEIELLEKIRPEIPTNLLITN